MSRNRRQLDKQYDQSSKERVVNDRQHPDYSVASKKDQNGRDTKSKPEQKVNTRNVVTHHQNPFQDDTVEIQRNFRRLRMKSEEKDFNQISNLNIESPNSNSIQQVKNNLEDSIQISNQSIKKNIPVSPTSQNNQLQQRQQKRKRIQKYESESVDEEEFQNYFTNPVKRMEFDMQRKRQQMKELASINAFSLGNFGIKDIKALKEALPKIEEIDVSPVQEKPKSYATVSLCCLSVTNPFRNKIIQFVIYNKWFDRFILLVIVTNCMFLAMDKGVDWVTNNNNTIDLIFLCIYTTEMTLKIIAMGFFMREFSYLREGWNIMDFFVVVLGWLSIVVSSDKISGIKVIRILRPLRTINQIPNMSSLVLTIVQTLPIVFDVGVLFFFALLMFGTIACQLLGGHFQSRCIEFNEKGNQTIFIGENALEYLCTKQADCDLQIKDRKTTCLYYGNPVQGTYSFDNILVSIMNIFIAITLEGWSTMMYYVRQSEQTYLYDWFFVTCVIVGNFIVLNLMVAVQASFLDQAFNEEESRIKDFNEKKENKRQAKLQQELEEIKQAELEEEEHKKNNENQDNDSDPDFRRRSTLQKKKICFKNPCRNFICPPWYQKFSGILLTFSQTKFFDNFIIFLILLNTVVLASEYYNSPDWLTILLGNFNVSFMILFTLEMVFKLIGNGYSDYFKDAFNIFDCFIVIMSYVDYFTPGNTPAIKMLRAFRLMRIFKLLRNWGSLRKLIGAVAESLTAIRNLGILIILYLFIGALLCKQFLGDYVLLTEAGPPSRNSFASTSSALITMFILLTGDSWNDLVSQTISTVGNFYVVILIISLLTIGNLFLLNLFLGILLRSISSEEDEEEEGVQKEEGEKKEGDQKDEVVQDNEQKADSQSKQEKSKSDEQKEEEEKALSDNKQNVSELNSSNSNVEEEFQYIKNKLMALASFNIDSKQDNSLRFDQQIKLKSPQLNKSIMDGTDRSEIDHEETQPKEEKKEEEKKCCTCCDKYMNYSLFILSPDNCFRKYLHMFVANGQFSSFIYSIIGLNSILLMLDIPALKDKYQQETIELLINIVSALFIGECVLKILVSGFFFGKNTYLKDPWNILDFVIVFFSVLTWILEILLGTSISFVRSFRALRALRPLRVVSTNEGMKTVVDALFHSIPALSNVLLIVLLFVLVFAILGIMLLVGQMGGCNNKDPTIAQKDQCFGNYSVDSLDNFGLIVETNQVPMIWNQAFTNYDNIFISMLTFYEIASTEAWPVRLWAAVDAVGYDQSPQKDYNQIMALLFVFYIFFVTFFIMNLFVSVIVDKFNEEIKKRQGSDNFSHQQQEWVKIQRLLVHTNPKIIPVEPINCFRLQCFRIVQSQFFEYVVMAAITLNTLFLCLDYYGKSPELDKALFESNFFFCMFFTVELLLKMLAYGFNYYWYVNWNKFDMVIVFSSLLTLDDSWLVDLNFNVTALRIIRVARLLRMIKTSEGIRQLLKTLFMSIQNIANTGALLILIFFTFSVVGMSLFSEQEYGNNYNDDANFKSFYISMMLVFRMSTGDSWNDLMHDCYDQFGFIAFVYHLAFNVIVQVIFLQVFIAVIGESFNENNATEDEGDILALKKRDIKAFQNTWAKYNPMGELYMKTIRLSDFLRELPPPLGYQGIRIEESKLNKIIYCLNIRDHQGRVYYPEVMWAIFHSIAGMNDDKVLCCEQIQNVLKLVRLKYRDLGKKISLDTLCGNKYYSKDVTAIKYIQAIKILQKWRNFKNCQINQREKEEQKRLKMLNLQEERKFEGSNDNHLSSPKNFKSPRSQRSHNKSLPEFDNISESADLAFSISERKGGYIVPG